MNSRLRSLALLIVMVPVAFSQERALEFDSDAARRRFSGHPPNMPKSIDPIVERLITRDGEVVYRRRSGAVQTKPFVQVPLIFRKNTDELLDEVSRSNVAKVAELLRELGAQDKGFAIEGHASAEGDPARNRELSRLRALRIQALLRESGVPSAVLVCTEGFGSANAQHPADAPENLLQADRRVLLVQEK